MHIGEVGSTPDPVYVRYGETNVEGRRIIILEEQLQKMFYGSISDISTCCKIKNGDYVFKDVPVVVTNFTLDMPTEVDYIAVNMSELGSTYCNDFRYFRTTTWDKLLTFQRNHK